MNDSNPFALLLASSVHDIKNSLSMLLDTLDGVVESTPITSDLQRHQFATLRGEAARINNSLMYLLGLYRMQQNQLSVQIQEVYVADFLDEQLAAGQLLFTMRELEVSIDCDDQLTGYFDTTLVGGIINNVLVNAARYARGSILLHAAQTPQGQLVIEVRDDGPGFPPKMLQDVSNQSRGIDFITGSTNLGLYFAGEVAQMHRRGEVHGHIELSNLVEGGSCFRLVLP
jgi:signal transduction histidine kinase